MCRPTVLHEYTHGKCSRFRPSCHRSRRRRRTATPPGCTELTPDTARDRTDTSLLYNVFAKKTILGQDVSAVG